MTEPVEEHPIVCPWCGETVMLVVEADLRGELVTDCEVCCHPWRVRIERPAGGLQLQVGRLDD